MDNIEDLPSDSSDDDYDPGKDSDADEEVSDVAEGTDSDNATATDGNSKKRSGAGKGKKRKKLRQGGDVTGSAPPKRRGGIQLDDAPNENAEAEKDGDVGNAAKTSDETTTEEDKDKLKADRLWADFMKDADVRPSSKKVSAAPKPLITTSSVSTPPTKVAEKPAKVEITRIFDFAGEEVRVKETVDANSKEAKQHVDANAASPALDRLKAAEPEKPSPSQGCSGTNKKLGLSGVLNKLGLKKKINVLDKSLLDWKDFKNKEGIEEDLKTFNKGKDGYIEKQAFLQRADLRQFEAEKNLRMSKRSNR